MSGPQRTRTAIPALETAGAWLLALVWILPIAYGLLASFGFSTSQFGCLQDLWQRESGWSYDAENPSGAYGIPQSLPGSKMAAAGADWETDPRTQIIWGLGYIKNVYGSPCAAWDFELANNYY